MKKISFLLALATAGAAHAAPSTLTQGFDNVAALSGSGWAFVNNSTAPVGDNWSQGNDGNFASQAGAPNAYAASNFLATGFNGGSVSNWLITPVLTLNNLSLLSLYVRNGGDGFLDTLEVRLSTNGASTNVGTTPTSVGDFSILLGTYSADAAPADWLRLTYGLSALAGPTDVRLAFRYVVADTTVNGNYLGLDTVSVSAVPEPAAYALMGLGVAGLLVLRRRTVR